MEFPILLRHLYIEPASRTIGTNIAIKFYQDTTSARSNTRGKGQETFRVHWGDDISADALAPCRTSAAMLMLWCYQLCNLQPVWAMTGWLRDTSETLVRYIFRKCISILSRVLYWPNKTPYFKWITPRFNMKIAEWTVWMDVWQQQSKLSDMTYISLVL